MLAESKTKQRVIDCCTIWCGAFPSSVESTPLIQRVVASTFFTNGNRIGHEMIKNDSDVTACNVLNETKNYGESPNQLQ